MAQSQEHAIPLPDRIECATARRHQLKVALRFGYIADNKEAGSLRTRTEYNLQGHPTFVYRFDHEGEISEKLRYEYDGTDTLIRKAVVETYRDGELNRTEEYLTDRSGRLVEYSETDTPNRTFRTAYTYDAAGRLLSKQVFEPDGLPGASEVWAYDAAGNCTEILEYELGRTVKRRATFSYDSQGRLSEELRYLQSNLLLYRLQYHYDEQGRCIRQDRFSRAGKPLGYESWTYSKRETEHLTLEPGQEKPLREVIRLDGQGREKERIVYEHDGSVFQWFQYLYDSTGTGAGQRRLLPNKQVDMEEIAVYDQEGRILSMHRRYPDESGDLVVQYRYDDAGLPMEEKHSSFDNESAVFWFVFERF